MKIKLLLTFLVAMMLLLGCERINGFVSRVQDNTFEWTEDVSLADGTAVLVKRTARLSPNNIAGGGGGSFNKGMTLQVVTPVVPALPKPWSDVYVPLLLERDPITKDWLLVATFFHCDSWYALGRPSLPYVQYRFKEGQWRREVLSTWLIGRKANLYIADHTPEHQRVTNKYKNENIEAGTGEKYMKILDKWSTGC